MVKYTLVYFPARARAELARLLFAQAGVAYEDKRVTFEEWGKLKPEAPTGQLPWLEIDGEKLGQSMAIARFLAREFSMYGDNNKEMSKIDMLLDTLVDFMDMAVKVKFAPDELKGDAKKKLLEKGPQIYKLFSDILSKNGSGFLVGSKVSVADLSTLATFAFVQEASGLTELEDQLKKHKNLVEHRDKIANLPKIKEWIAKRPKTDF